MLADVARGRRRRGDLPNEIAAAAACAGVASLSKSTRDALRKPPFLFTAFNPSAPATAPSADFPPRAMASCTPYVLSCTSEELLLLPPPR